jgi:uncharacterized repeat protein (TIGR04138 family)
MQAVSFEEGVERILKKEPRYHRNAYALMRDALDFTQKLLGREGRLQKGKVEKEQHVSAEELLCGIRDYSLQTYGPMSLMLLEEWGIRSCRDFGEIVFIMVENGLLKKTDKDSRADFEQGYDFEATFREPYLPESKKRRKSLLQPRATRA